MQSTYLHEAQGARNPKETQHPEEGELWDLAVRKDSEHLRHEDFEEGEEHDRAIEHVPVVCPVAAAPDEGDNQAGHQWQSMALEADQLEEHLEGEEERDDETN